MKRRVFLLAILMTFAVSTAAFSAARVKVIFETDMGNDIDDALALDMLYKYALADRAEILAVMLNNPLPESIEFVDIMNTWYGFPDIPIGRIENGPAFRSKREYVHSVVADKSYVRSRSDYDALPLAVELYRKLLAESRDRSVVIISVGFSTNLAALLQTAADEYSPLDGRELFARKVKAVYVMGGEFTDAQVSEFNIKHDIASAQTFFAECPVDMVFSGGAVGAAICYPATSIMEDFDCKSHPLAVAYKSYMEMPYDRPTWDLTSVLAAVEGDDAGWFDYSAPGHVVVADNGQTCFVPCRCGRHRLMSVPENGADRIRDRFVQLIGKTH